MFNIRTLQKVQPHLSFSFVLLVYLLLPSVKFPPVLDIIFSSVSSLLFFWPHHTAVQDLNNLTHRDQTWAPLALPWQSSG